MKKLHVHSESGKYLYKSPLAGGSDILCWPHSGTLLVSLCSNNITQRTVDSFHRICDDLWDTVLSRVIQVIFPNKNIN